MSAGRWADRFRTWYHQRKAEAVLRGAKNELRRYWICPDHFVQMKYFPFSNDGFGRFDPHLECPECEKEEAERVKQTDLEKIERALRTLLKGKKDGAV